MKTKKRDSIHSLLFLTLIVAALAAGTIVSATRTEERSFRNNSRAAAVNVAERGGCPVWGGRRLRSTNSDVLSVQFTLGLGRISADGETGNISLREKVITSNSYTPDVLALSFFVD